MIQAFIVELSVEPPMERPHHQGLIARLTISNNGPCEHASIRAKRFRGPMWMEFEPGTELKDAEACTVDSERARTVLDRVLNAKLSLISSSRSCFHPTTYKVKIFQGASSCEFSWWDELPSDWLPLADIVHEIENLSNEVLGVT